MKKNDNELASNRKAYYNYEILESFEAGIALLGTEIKSLRENGASLQEAYITIKKQELYLINASIAPYRFGNVNNHEERRERKLLMHSYEIEKLKKSTKEKGLAIIPLSLYFKKHTVKLKFGLGKGKKLHDKRAKLREKEENAAIRGKIF